MTAPPPHVHGRHTDGAAVRPERARSGFTLIELMVVVTIMVVLMALLAPALDRAIYEAQLVVCSAQLKTIGTGVTLYANDHRRWLPLNTWSNGAGWITSGLRSGVTTVATLNDIRPVYGPYVTINKSMNDPMVDAIDLENAPTSTVYGSYSLFSSWRFSGESKRQSKQGDRFNWRGWSKTDPERTWDILACDFMRSVGEWWNSHPDRSQVSALMKFEPSENTPPPTDFTSTYWITPTGQPRGEIDVNFVRQDGSVETYRDVKALREEGFVYVPENADGSAALQHMLPER